MQGKLLQTLRKPPSDLLLNLLRVGGTRGFLLVVRLLRALHVIPRAFQAGRDTASILVVFLSPHLGDAVMLSPLLEALTHHSPGMPVDLAIEEHAAPIYADLPDLRRVYPLSLGLVPPEGSAATIRRIGRVLLQYLRCMRDCRPAICLMPRWGDDLFRSFYLAVLTGAPRRVGFATAVGAPRYRLAPYRDRLLTEAWTGAAGLHEPDRMVWLAYAARLLPDGSDQSSGTGISPALMALAFSVDWSALAMRLGIEHATEYAVLAPGASQAHKIWPSERWGDVIWWLAARGVLVVLLSGSADRSIAEQLHRSHPADTVLAAGVTTLAESAALLQHAALFLGNDSGPAHIAGALGIPSIVLFTASNDAHADDPFSPRRNRPNGPWVRVLQPLQATAPCVFTCTAATAHCIQSISADTVIQSADSLLQSTQQEGAT